MTLSDTDLIKLGTAQAFALCVDRLGAEFEPEPDIRLVEGNHFLARAGFDGEMPIVEISSRCVSEIKELWDIALQSRILLDEAGERMAMVDGEPVTKERLVLLSITWLILHELMHFRLAHLDLLEVLALSECDLDEDEEIEPSGVDWVDQLSEEQRALLRPCLELQADNDASETLLGVYDESAWSCFRIEAAAIFAVMAVMERAEAKSGKPTRTYPLVATRFFTLFAQLFQYWLYRDAHLEVIDGESVVRSAQDLNSRDFQRYMKTVLALTINDVVQLSSLAGANSFLDDLGGGGELFSDIYEIQYADKLIAAPLKTIAANEWRDLWPVNEAVMAASGLRDD